MNKILILAILLFPLTGWAQNTHSVVSEKQAKTVSSPPNRVALLELYTSEGCSSCPPADRFLSELKKMGISEKQLIPMAFHVTYWDYIGWKDRFANKQYDQRQRDLAQKNRKKSVYTPQFLLVGDDYRSYANFSEDINKLVAEKATVDLELIASKISDEEGNDRLQLRLISNINSSKLKQVGFYFAVIENNLSSNVADGENNGELLHHDYVVRKLSEPYFYSKPDVRLETEHDIVISPEWKRQDLSIIAFAENPLTGEVLQAVKLKY